jgi:hypothetical protein
MALVQGVNIKGQRIILGRILGYVKVNDLKLRIDTHGGIDEAGDESGIYVDFDTKKELEDCLSYLDFTFGITEL